MLCNSQVRRSKKYQSKTKKIRPQKLKETQAARNDQAYMCKFLCKICLPTSAYCLNGELNCGARGGIIERYDSLGC